MSSMKQKYYLMILIAIIILIIGCAPKIQEVTEETPQQPQEKPSSVETVAPIVPVEQPKKYEFKTLYTERDSSTALCSIVSSLTNLDSVSHRFNVDSFILIGGKKTNLGKEFNLGSGREQRINEQFECPDNKAYSLNATVKLVI